MGEPSTDSLHDVYEDQLSAARFKAERDAAVQELQAMRERNLELWMDCGMEHELTRCAEDKAERLGKLVWRLQNRLARSHRRERNLRKGMRMWREKAIGGPVHTVSAYDLLPEEDLQALRWVREHGGLSHVKGIYHDFRDVVESLGIEWSQSELHGLMDALDRRLMPEGMEWPRYEDGEPVRFGDELPEFSETIYKTVRSVSFQDNGVVTIENDGGSANVMVILRHKGERVKRPHVLAADGEPLEVGQTVWDVEDGKEFEVVNVNGELPLLKFGETAYTATEPEHLTHQRPVLDADGVPIKVGDTVYEVGKNYPPFIVGRLPEPGAYRSVMVMYPNGNFTYLDPERITHTKPDTTDSWEKWREDFIKPPCIYCRDILGVEFDNDTELDKAFDAQIQDMEHRARALAERGE